MKKPIIAIYTGATREDGSDLFENEYKNLAYSELSRFILEKGAIPVFLIDMINEYEGGRSFGAYFSVDLYNSGALRYELVNETIRVDLLLERSGFSENSENPDLNELNGVRFFSRAIREICRDKYMTYLFAPDFHANSFLINNSHQLGLFILSHDKQNIVLKKPVSSYGKGVFVGQSKDYKGDLKFPLLAQEFIDTSGGYNGLVEGHHDLRVVLCDGDPIHGLLRQPPEGSLKSTSVSDGAKSEAIFIKNIPREVIDLARQLDSRLTNYFNIAEARMFSADFGYNGNEWKLIEMNSSPSLAHESIDGLAANEFLELLATKLVEHARKNQ